MNNFIVYDFETSGRSSRFDQILQAGIIIYDQNLKVLNKLNLKSRINSDIVPSINALRVNKLKISDILSEKMSCYEMTMQMHSFLSKFQILSIKGGSLFLILGISLSSVCSHEHI